MTDLSKVLGARWKELGAEEKGGFEERAKKLAAQYKEDKAKYDEEHPKVCDLATHAFPLSARARRPSPSRLPALIPPSLAASPRSLLGCRATGLRAWLPADLRDRRARHD